MQQKVSNYEILIKAHEANYLVVFQ